MRIVVWLTLLIVPGVFVLYPLGYYWYLYALMATTPNNLNLQSFTNSYFLILVLLTLFLLWYALLLFRWARRGMNRRGSTLATFGVCQLIMILVIIVSYRMLSSF
jgi:hypothetical protein